MYYLSLNIVLSSFFVLCVKWVQGRREDVVTVGAINYIVAAIAAAPFYWGSPPATTVAVLTGALNGLCYFVAFFFLIVAVSLRGAANVSAVTRLSILLPIGLGILVLHERPGAWQAIGIALAFSSLFLIGRSPEASKLASDAAGRRARSRGLWALGLLFFISGGSRMAQELFKHLSTPEQHSTFLFFLFLVSAVASVVVLIVRRRRIRSSEIVIGAALGFTNLLQTFFILKALEELPGFIVFPVTSAGGLAFTSLVAIMLLHERLSPRNYLGLAIAIGSLVLLRQG